MRFEIHDIDALKRKAKFIKKYLCHPFIGRPDIELGAVQRTLAVAMGYADWAELALVSARQSHDEQLPGWHASAFLQLSKALAGLAGIDGCLADALTFRMGFAPDGHLRTPATKAGFPNLRYSDLLLDRLLEVEAGSRDASTIRQAMNDVYERVIDGLREEEQSDREGRKAAAEWIETIAIWMGWDIASWRDRDDSFRRPIAYIQADRIMKIADELPSKGLLVMSGCFGSGRSTTPRMLSLALRGGRTTMFHMASELISDAAVTPHGVYRDEMRSLEKFADVAKEAESKLVMVQLGAGSSAAAYALMIWLSKSYIPLGWKNWLGANLVGGVHHDWSYEERPGLIQRIEQWWTKDAVVSHPSLEFPDGYVTLRKVSSL